MHIISHVRVRKWSKSLKCNKETMRNTDWRADTDFRVNKDCFLSPDGGARVLSAHIRRHSSPDVWPSSHNSLSRFKTVLSCKVSIGLWSHLPLLSLAKKEINPGRAAEASGCWLTPRSPSCSDDAASVRPSASVVLQRNGSVSQQSCDPLTHHVHTTHNKCENMFLFISLLSRADHKVLTLWSDLVSSLQSIPTAPADSPLTPLHGPQIKQTPVLPLLTSAQKKTNWL